MNSEKQIQKYFFSLEKTTARAKTMTSIDNGETVIKENTKILQEQRRFYSSLYKSNPAVQFIPPKHSTVKIEDDERDNIENEITEQEVANALKQMARNKTPGVDGLSVEFYIVFFSKLKRFMVDAFNHAFRVKKIHQ